MSVQNVTNPSLQNLVNFLHTKMCKLKIAHTIQINTFPQILSSRFVATTQLNLPYSDVLHVFDGLL